MLRKLLLACWFWCLVAGIIIMVGYAADNKSATSVLTDSEKAEILLIQTQLTTLQLRQQQAAQERDQRVEAAIRQAIESWYQTSTGSQFGVVASQLAAMSQKLNDTLKSIGDRHGCSGCVLDSNMQLVRPPPPAAPAAPPSPPTQVPAR